MDLCIYRSHSALLRFSNNLHLERSYTKDWKSLQNKNLYKQTIEISNTSFFLCSNIPAAPVFRAYAYQLIRYSRVCGSYQDFRDIGLLLTRKLLYQWFLLIKLRTSLVYGRHHDLVVRYGLSVSQMTTCRKYFPIFSSFITYHQVCN